MQRTKKSLKALSLAICVLVALLCGSVAAWAAGGWPEGESTDNTLTVTASENSDYQEDLTGEGVNLVADVYQIAKAEKDSSYVKYNYKAMPSGPFSGLDIKSDGQWDADALKTLAEDAAKLVEDDTPYVRVPADGTVAKLPDDGLYLILPHGESVTVNYGPDVLSSLVAHGAVRKDNTQYDYIFSPSLFAAPNTDSGTTDGNWLREIKVVLKPSPEERYGSLIINKTVQNREGYSIRPTSFAFHVTGTQPNGKKIDDYKIIQYSGGTPEPAKVEHVQAGTILTVEEVPLNEATWNPVGDTVKIANPIVADSETVPSVSVDFTNDYVPTKGIAVENKFELQSTGTGDDQWDWKLIQVTPESAQTEPTA